MAIDGRQICLELKRGKIIKTMISSQIPIYLKQLRRDLYKIIKSTSNQLKHSVTNENFKEAMDYLANLRLPLDNFLTK